MKKIFLLLLFLIFFPTLLQSSISLTWADMISECGNHLNGYTDLMYRRKQLEDKKQENIEIYQEYSKKTGKRNLDTPEMRKISRKTNEISKEINDIHKQSISAKDATIKCVEKDEKSYDPSTAQEELSQFKKWGREKARELDILDFLTGHAPGLFGL